MTHQPTRPTTGSEYAAALSDVIRDQEARSQRRDEARPAAPRSRVPMLVGATLVCAALAGWAVVAPPAFLLPPPLPQPPPQVIEAGLRIDMASAARAVNARYEVAGSLPGSLAEVLESAEDGAGIEYQPLPGGAFRLVGQRGEAVVVYDSSEPLGALLTGARDVLSRTGNP